MSKASYGVGDTIILREGPLRAARMDGQYEILAILPDAEGQVQYRVRSRSEGFDRRILSSEIDTERSAKSKIVKTTSSSRDASEPWFKASSIKIHK